MYAQTYLSAVVILLVLNAPARSRLSVLASQPALIAADARQGSSGGNADTHQSLPCGDQTRSFKDLMAALDKGRVPSPAEISGTWVLVGLWLYKNSQPDLNCKGLNRPTDQGTKLEWAMIANGYSIEFDAIGISPQMTSLKPDQKGNLTFSIGWGGESSPVFRCRLAANSSLVCSGDTYYEGAEFKKLPISEDQLYRPKPGL
jgi:hypothetical protein